MRRINKRAGALLGAVLCVCACLAGCERGEAAPSAPPPAPESQPVATPEAQPVAASKGSSTMSIDARAKDREYQAELQESIAAQRRKMVPRRNIEKQMAQLREQARQALPAGATEEQVRAELEGNPRKYPAWHELTMAMKSNIAEVQRDQLAAQAALRRRILLEKTKGRAQGAAPAEK